MQILSTISEATLNPLIIISSIIFIFISILIGIFIFTRFGNKVLSILKRQAELLENLTTDIVNNNSEQEKHNTLLKEHEELINKHSEYIESVTEKRYKRLNNYSDLDD